jgi:hypothetical protein
MTSRRKDFFKFLFERGESPNTTLRIPYKFEAEVGKMRNVSVVTRTEGVDMIGQLNITCAVSFLDED